MKTKELIEQLLKIDPSGETEVCINNLDINYLDKVESYYDGRLERLVKDKNNTVVGGKYLSNGLKVRIITTSIEQCLLDNPDLTVDFSELDEHLVEIYKNRVERYRAVSKKIIHDIVSR